MEALPLLEQGKLVPRKQEDALSCYAHLIDKTMGELDFTKSAEILDRLIRGLNPWPSAYTTYHGKQLKVWEARAGEESEGGKARGNSGSGKGCGSCGCGKRGTSDYQPAAFGEKENVRP